MSDIIKPVGVKTGEGQLPQQTTYTRYLYVKQSYRGWPFPFYRIVKMEITRNVKEAPAEDWEFKRLFLNESKSAFVKNEVLYIIDGVREINDRPIKDEQNPIGS